MQRHAAFLEEYNDTIYLSAESPCKGKPLALESAGFFDYGHCRTAIGCDFGADTHFPARGGDLALCLSQHSFR